MKLIHTMLLSAILLITGCIGTDLINEAPVEKEDGYIIISSEKHSFQINETLSLTATTYDAEDNPVSNQGVHWTSSDESIITISDDGTLTGLSVGQVTITASSEGFTSATTMMSVFIDPNAVASIDISPSQVELEIGATVLLIAVAKNGNGETIAGADITWNNDNSSVASVNEIGLVTALAQGVANITASIGDIRSSNTSITVRTSMNSKSGSFVEAPGTSYNLAGTAELIQENKNLLLKFGDDFLSSNGPGLYVYLSPTQAVSAGSVELGELKSTSGAQEYNLANRSIDEFSYVIIHCKPFNVSFGWARLD